MKMPKNAEYVQEISMNASGRWADSKMTLLPF